MPRAATAGPAEAGNRNSIQSPAWWQGPQYLSHDLLPPVANSSRKLEEQCSQDLNPGPLILAATQKAPTLGACQVHLLVLGTSPKPRGFGRHHWPSGTWLVAAASLLRVLWDSWEQWAPQGSSLPR